MKYLILLTIFLSLNANSVMENDSYYVLELNFEANESKKMEPLLIKTSTKLPQNLKASDIFSLKEFEHLSKKNISF